MEIWLSREYILSNLVGKVIDFTVFSTSFDFYQMMKHTSIRFTFFFLCIDRRTILESMNRGRNETNLKNMVECTKILGVE